MTAHADKQRLLLKYLISSPELFTRVNPILDSKFFDTDLKPVAAYLKQHFETYRALPTSEQLHVETGIGLETEALTYPELKYAEGELERFCRDKAIEHAILSCVGLMKDEENHEEMMRLMRDAITISIQRNLGTDYFLDVEARLQKLLETQASIPTKMRKLDEAIGGGCNRKEMIIFAAPSGVGKSLTMSNVGRNMCMQGLHGVYITLELAEEIVSKRHDSIFTGIAQYDILNNITKTVVELKKAQDNGCGTLMIKRMPESSTNSNHIRAYLKEYELVYQRVPDFVIVDYLDLMASVEKVSVENMFVKDKYIAEELRAIANEYNLAMITASQLNRGAQQIENLEDLNQAHIAGGISKINTTDNLVAIIQTPQMKARGEMMFKMLKTRSSSGVGSYFLMRFDPISLRLTDMDNGDQPNPQITDRISSFRNRAASNTVPVPAAPSKEPPAKAGLAPWESDGNDLFQV